MQGCHKYETWDIQHYLISAQCDMWDEGIGGEGLFKFIYIWISLDDSYKSFFGDVVHPMPKVGLCYVSCLNLGMSLQIKLIVVH